MFAEVMLAYWCFLVVATKIWWLTLDSINDFENVAPTEPTIENDRGNYQTHFKWTSVLIIWEKIIKFLRLIKVYFCEIYRKSNVFGLQLKNNPMEEKWRRNSIFYNYKGSLATVADLNKEWFTWNNNQWYPGTDILRPGYWGLWL